ncbi:MAG: EamA family transporter [Flavobacteriaceae bacterium]|nr:EamA family transporter [Flavobacteriaceae bacterium]
MDIQKKKWLYLIILALIWGSSFILMKKSLLGLTPVQVGAFRVLIAAVVIVSVGFKNLKGISKKQWKHIVVTSFLGTFFPAFLFAFAVQKIDSSVAAILNSLTPLNTLLIGTVLYGFVFRKRQFAGVLMGLIGTVVLILKGAALHPNHDYFYAVFVIVSSIGYAFNVNILKRHLGDLSAMSVTVAQFVLLIVPAMVVIYATGFLTEFTWQASSIESFMYVTVLAVLGTGVAKVLFNNLVKIASPVFSSSVTYLIPIVAIVWGLLDGERLSMVQVASAVLIMLGVYLVNAKPKKSVSK